MPDPLWAMLEGMTTYPSTALLRLPPRNGSGPSWPRKRSIARQKLETLVRIVEELTPSDMVASILLL